MLGGSTRESSCCPCSSCTTCIGIKEIQEMRSLQYVGYHDHVGSSSVGKNKVLRKIGLGTFSNQPVRFAPPRQKKGSDMGPSVGTQESANEGAKSENKQPMRARLPSQRILRNRIRKIVPGPGLSSEDAMMIE